MIWVLTCHYLLKNRAVCLFIPREINLIWIEVFLFLLKVWSISTNFGKFVFLFPLCYLSPYEDLEEKSHFISPCLHTTRVCWHPTVTYWAHPFVHWLPYRCICHPVRKIALFSSGVTSCPLCGHPVSPDVPRLLYCAIKLHFTQRVKWPSN